MADNGGQGANVLTILGVLGGGGLVSALFGHLFGWRKNQAEAAKTLQDMVDGRLKILLEADQTRLAQMSAALSQQGDLIQGLQKQTSDQSDKIDRLESAIEALVAHISSLERMLRAKKIQPPPRPAIAVAD